MKLIAAVALVACTSTRQLASPVDPRLRVADHGEGFVVATTERWHERIDPNTRIRFHSHDAGWSPRLEAGDLYVDDRGSWIDRSVPFSELADAVEITDLSAAAAAQLELARPEAGRLDGDGARWRLVAPAPALRRWLHDFELGVARLDPAGASVVVCDGDCRMGAHHQLIGDEALLYNLRYTHSAEALGTWRVYSRHQGWLPAVQGPALIALLDNGRETKAGWRWTDVDRVEVENISGGKTLGAIIGTSAVAIALLPVAFALNGIGGHPGSANMPVGGGGGGGTSDEGDWSPELVDSASVGARRLFAMRSRVHAVVRGTAVLDAGTTRRGDVIASGMIARVRLGDVFEIGGGVRYAEVHDAMAWSHATTGVFQIGLHLPLDAGFRVAIPLGFEAGGGGRIEHDVRFPWGLRYTSASGRWFGTVWPATPSHLRLEGERAGRWSLAFGSELGVSF